ncbi:hypothetical protein [Halostagnicola sp. A-GB9-2]|uniref:hypothetical protein n=1 Tax=Halostagnicola sp. A-GB9-2 TaxID=3048066 RepID=UPI0024BF9A7E|nr:hypothetical protein [Halostagnicola sp. A-GB9-2]MDJ1432450.1 hypothetical protein [Halostagnicola sp. A-GB9-2]
MKDRPDLFMVAEAFVLGLLATAGILYATLGSPLAESFPAISGMGVVAWAVGLIGGTILLAEWRHLTTGALLGGELLGLFAGLWVFAMVVGWSFVMFAIVPIGITAVVTGSWVAYEREQQYGNPREPPVGTWRHVFAILILLPSVFLGLLLFA